MSRLDQLLEWCGDDFDGCIVFDECHKAKNATTETASARVSKSALAVLHLQKKLPQARVVYASATGIIINKHDNEKNVDIFPIFFKTLYCVFDGICRCV